MAKPPNKKTKELYKIAVDYGCVVCRKEYGVRTEACIHHLTGAGMGKKSDKIIPLCHYHHQGKEGIHHIGTKKWEKKFGTQTELEEYFLAHNSEWM